MIMTMKAIASGIKHPTSITTEHPASQNREKKPCLYHMLCNDNQMKKILPLPLSLLLVPQIKSFGKVSIISRVYKLSFLAAFTTITPSFSKYYPIFVYIQIPIPWQSDYFNHSSDYIYQVSYLAPSVIPNSSTI